MPSGGWQSAAACYSTSCAGTDQSDLRLTPPFMLLLLVPCPLLYDFLFLLFAFLFFFSFLSCSSFPFLSVFLCPPNAITAMKGDHAPSWPRSAGLQAHGAPSPPANSALQAIEGWHPRTVRKNCSTNIVAFCLPSRRPPGSPQRVSKCRWGFQDFDEIVNHIHHDYHLSIPKPEHPTDRPILPREQRVTMLAFPMDHRPPFLFFQTARGSRAGRLSEICCSYFGNHHGS